MTVIELLTVVACIASGYFMGSWLGGHYGVVGWVMGIIVGVGFFVGAYVLFRKWLSKL